jgi:hypothetical protein
MKRLILILLLLVYGSTSMGMTLHVHYCCGKLKSIRLSQAEHNCCNADGKECDDKKCCEDKQISFQVQDEPEAFEGFSYIAFPEIANSVFPSFKLPVLIQSASPPLCISAPRFNLSGLFQLYCNYRI